MTVVYLINRLPSSVLKIETPFFKLYGIHPIYNSLKVFGCRYFPYLRDYAKNKFTPKSYPCVFLGYSPMHKGYRCFHPPTKRVYLSHHVIFDEKIFPYADPKLLFSPAQQNNIFFLPLVNLQMDLFGHHTLQPQANHAVHPRHKLMLIHMTLLLEIFNILLKLTCAAENK
jgi:hypothetical protein